MGILSKQTKPQKCLKLNFKKPTEWLKMFYINTSKVLKEDIDSFWKNLRLLLHVEIWQNPSFSRPLWNFAFSLENGFLTSSSLHNIHGLKKVHVYPALEEGRNERFAALAGQAISLRCQ